MPIIDLYIGRIILQHFFMVFGVLLGLFLFVTFIDQINDIGTGTYTLWDAVRYTLLTTPRTIYELFPLVALLGTILGLSAMAMDSELVVIRAAGYSIAQIVGAVLKVGIVFVVAAFLLGEFVTPATETMANRARAEALQRDIRQQSNFGLWMRDDMTYVNVGEVLPDLSLRNVRVFEFDESGHLRSLVYAENGTFEETHWRLDDVRQTFIDEDGAESRRVDVAAWRTTVTPDILAVFLIRPDQLSAWQLRPYINHLQRNNQETGAYELAFWNKLMAPVSTAIMVLLGVPFVFRSVRSGGLGVSLLIGIMIGLTFFVVTRGFGYLVLVYDVPPQAGSVLPVGMFLIAALVLLRRVT
jgi:lipopolysaccharide export system permease protein